MIQYLNSIMRAMLQRNFNIKKKTKKKLTSYLAPYIVNGWWQEEQREICNEMVPSLADACFPDIKGFISKQKDNNIRYNIIYMFYTILWVQKFW